MWAIVKFPSLLTSSKTNYAFFLDLQVIFDDKKYLRMTELRHSCIKSHLAEGEGRLTRKYKGNRENFESLFAKVV